jgi:4-hydroxy-tetrahydrodipicolinate reductase
MNKYKYGLIGSTGKLGNEVKQVFSENRWELIFEKAIDVERQDGIPQLLIDCSLPENFSNVLSFTKKFNSPLIIATTGLSQNQFDELKNLSKSIPVVQSYNYSVGIQILLKLAKEVKKYAKDWDVEILETHHRFKKDKPSGTAIMIAKALDQEIEKISSQRLGNVFGEHTIKFGGLGEVITISHSATSRRTFAEGIFLSAQFILNKKNGLFSFTDIVQSA